jgi:hypothetical protein
MQKKRFTYQTIILPESFLEFQAKEMGHRGVLARLDKAKRAGVKADGQGWKATLPF